MKQIELNGTYTIEELRGIIEQQKSEHRAAESSEVKSVFDALDGLVERKKLRDQEKQNELRCLMDEVGKLSVKVHELSVISKRLSDAGLYSLDTLYSYRLNIDEYIAVHLGYDTISFNFSDTLSSRGVKIVKGAVQFFGISMESEYCIPYLNSVLRHFDTFYKAYIIIAKTQIVNEQLKG